MSWISETLSGKLAVEMTRPKFILEYPIHDGVACQSINQNAVLCFEYEVAQDSTASKSIAPLVSVHTTCPRPRSSQSGAIHV
jgi:hypothetical protein